MGRKSTSGASLERAATSQELSKAPDNRMSLKALFNDDGFDLGNAISLLLSDSQLQSDKIIARQALFGWIFLAPSPTCESSARTAISQVILVKSALLLDRKCIRNPAARTTRTLTKFQELHRVPYTKWLLENIFLPLGGFGELVKCKSVSSMNSDVRKRLRLFDTVLPVVTILHFAALSSTAHNGESKRLSLAQAISTYLHKHFELLSPPDPRSIDSQPSHSSSTKKDKLGQRQLKFNWAAVKDQIGFLYAAHFVQMASGKTLAQHMSQAGLSKPIDQDTLVRFLGLVRTFHEDVLYRMTNADDWHIEFPTTLPKVEFPVSAAFADEHRAIVREHFRNKEQSDSAT